MGLAIGYRKRETAAFGVDFTKRGRIFDEWLEIVTRLWAGRVRWTLKASSSASGARKSCRRRRAAGNPLFIGGFAGKAVDHVVKYGDGYLGSDDVCIAYADKLREEGRDIGDAKVRITGLMTVVARDPEVALEKLAPYYHHVNNSYGEWFAEDRAMGKESFQPMDLDAFKQSGTLQVVTPEQAVAMFRDLQWKMPLDHYMMAMPPGLPAERFVHYAQQFASDVLPAFD